MQELTSDSTEERANIDFEVTERSTESSDKITALVYPTQNKNKTHKSSSKVTPTVLDTTKNKTRVTKVVEITDMPKVSNIDKPSHPRYTRITSKHSRPNLNNRNTPTTEFTRIEKLIQIQDPDSTPPNEH